MARRILHTRRSPQGGSGPVFWVGMGITSWFEDVHRWGFPKMGAPPKSSIGMGVFLINHPFWVPPFMETSIDVSKVVSVAGLPISWEETDLDVSRGPSSQPSILAWIVVGVACNPTTIPCSAEFGCDPCSIHISLFVLIIMITILTILKITIRKITLITLTNLVTLFTLVTLITITAIVIVKVVISS